MSSISGLQLLSGKNLNHWHSLVEEWILAHERFARINPGDAAYWYTERANIGVLAGAAWRCGMVALEEYQAVKTKQSAKSRSDPRTWMGRCDLWLAREKHQEIIEAKFKWLSLRSKKPVEIVNQALTIAVRDAKSTQGKNPVRATGLVFLPIYSSVRLTKSPENLVSGINSLVKKLSNCDATLLAWCFPESTRGLVGAKEMNYIPGVFMVARAVA